MRIELCFCRNYRRVFRCVLGTLPIIGKQMRRVLSLFSLALVHELVAPAIAETYQLSGKSYEMTWTKGDWDGSMGFPKVYCAKAPMPEKAISFVQTMFNGNAIYVGKILYPDNVLLAVVFSSMPAGRSAQEEFEKQLARSKESQERARAAALLFEVSELSTKFGPTVGVRINNVESDTPNTGPFPLAKNIVARKDGALSSMSVHRLFAKGSDRFEVAAMQMLSPASSNAVSERDVAERLIGAVESLTESLQSCTQSLPDRVGR